MRELLEQPWWQGVAGLAQIIAGVLALATIWQARALQQDADRQRHESVAPDWELNSAYSRTVPAAQLGQENQADVTFTNVGFGPARRVQARFLTTNRTEPTTIAVLGDDYGQVAASSTCTISMRWAADASPVGQLMIECTSRYGGTIRRSYPIRLFREADGTPEIDIKPMPI